MNSQAMHLYNLCFESFCHQSMLLDSIESSEFSSFNKYFVHGPTTTWIIENRLNLFL